MIIFQLIAFLIELFVASFILGTTLFILFLIIVKFKNSENTNGVMAKGFWFPFTLIPYFIFAIVLNIIVSVYLRDVDPNIGDAWSIKITENVELLTIDTLDRWRLSPTGVGEAISDKIKLISVTSEFAAGETQSGNYFLYDKGLTHYTEFKNYANLQSKLSTYGVNKLSFTSPTEYYFNERRFGDNIMLFLIFIFPIYRFYCLLKMFKSTT